MIKYLTVPTLKFDQGKLTSKELDKRVRFASKKQYSVWDYKVINRDPYARRALTTQSLLAALKETTLTELASILTMDAHELAKCPFGSKVYIIRAASKEDLDYALSIAPKTFKVKQG